MQPDADWASIGDDWRRLYRPTIDSVTRGEVPWATFDALQLQMLEQVLGQHGVRGLSDEQVEQLSFVWRRMDPWPDVVPGLSRLKEQFIICALSNGSMAQLIALAKFGRIPWDGILSVEMFRAYKPDPRVYLGAAELLQLEPAEIMMVACHPYDIQAARTNGMQTAYVARPMEWGSQTHSEDPPAGTFDVLAADFEDLASQLRT